MEYADLTREEYRTAFEVDSATLYRGSYDTAARASVYLLLDNTLAVVERRFKLNRPFASPIGEESERVLYRGEDATAACAAVDKAAAAWPETYRSEGRMRKPFRQFGWPRANEVMDAVGKLMLRREAAERNGVTATV